MLDTKRIFRFALACAGAVAIAGCSDANGPEEFDPVSTNQAAAEVLATFNDNPAMLAIDALSSTFPDIAGAASPAAASPEAAWPAGVSEDLKLLDKIGPFLSPTDAAAIFPADLLGATFVYNAETSEYEVDPDLTDAPENGIRIILYAVDPILRRPTTPLDSIGYLDLTDESAPSADALGVFAEVNGITYLDYVASAVQETGSVTFTADGFLSDGESQVRFTLSHVWSEATGITVDYLIWVPGQDTELDLELNLNGQTEAITMRLSVTHDGNNVTLEATAAEGSLDGSIEHNGNLVVDISGTPQQPVFTDAAGNELTNQDLQALAALFGTIGFILDGFDNLLIPAYLVFSVSIFAGW